MNRWGRDPSTSSGKNANYRTLAFDLYVGCTTRKSAADEGCRRAASHTVQQLGRD